MRLPELVVVLGLSAACCFAQQVSVQAKATVLIYTPSYPFKQQLRNTVMPKGNASIAVWVYDEKSRLAHLDTSRFVVFDLSSGPHLFSASASDRKPSEKTVALNLVAGERYCLRTDARYVAVPVEGAGVIWGRLEAVPCGQAAKELGKAKPVEARRIDGRQMPNVDACMVLPPQTEKHKTRLTDPQPVADPAACLALLP